MRPSLHVVARPHSQLKAANFRKGGGGGIRTELCLGDLTCKLKLAPPKKSKDDECGPAPGGCPLLPVPTMERHRASFAVG